MADNVTLDVGTGGAIVATDQVPDGGSNPHYQLVKLAFGALNTATIVSTSNGLPVDLRADNLAGNLDVNIAAQTSDVTIADGGNVISVDDAGGSLTIDGTVTANAGTGTFTVTDDGSFTLAANDGVDIGDVSVNSLIPGNSATQLGKQVGNAAGGTDNGVAPMLVRDDTLGTLTPTDGQYTHARTNNRGAQWVVHDGDVNIADGGNVISVDDAGSTISVDDGGGSLTVDVSGTVTVDSELPAAAALADNTANPTVPGVGAFGLVFDGSTWDRMQGTSADGVLVNMGSNNDVTATGNVAHDAVDSGNPVKIGGVARSTQPANVANNDRVDAYFDKLGRIVTRPQVPRELVASNRITLTTTTETTLIAAGGANVFRDLVYVLASNESASEVRVDFRDSTAGTIRFSIDLAPDGGGWSGTFPVPWPQATANNNWTAQLSTAVSTVYLSALAVEDD